MNYAILTFLVVFTILEGKREHLFYIINRKGKFPDIPTDKQRKRLNAFMFTLIFAFIGYITKLSWLQIGSLLGVSYAIRWIFLDGVLNILRDLHFFYVGTVAGTDTSIRKFANWVSWPPELIMAFGKIISLAVFSILYVLLNR